MHLRNLLKYGMGLYYVGCIKTCSIRPPLSSKVHALLPKCSLVFIVEYTVVEVVIIIVHPKNKH